MKVLPVYSVAIWCLYASWIQANVLNPDQQLDVMNQLKNQEDQLTRQNERISRQEEELDNLKSLLTSTVSNGINLKENFTTLISSNYFL